MNAKDMARWLRVLAILVVPALLPYVVAMWHPIALAVGAGSVIQMPLLALESVLATIAALAALAAAFMGLGLDDKRQALGLPEGSGARKKRKR